MGCMQKNSLGGPFDGQNQNQPFWAPRCRLSHLPACWLHFIYVLLDLVNWWFNLRITSDCDKRDGWSTKRGVNEGVRIEVVMEVSDRKKTRKHESSLFMIYWICIREGGAWPVSGGFRYWNLLFLVQGVGKGTEGLCGRWVWTPI